MEEMEMGKKFEINYTELNEINKKQFVNKVRSEVDAYPVDAFVNIQGVKEQKKELTQEQLEVKRKKFCKCKFCGQSMRYCIGTNVMICENDLCPQNIKLRKLTDEEKEKGIKKYDEYYRLTNHTGIIIGEKLFS